MHDGVLFRRFGAVKLAFPHHLNICPDCCELRIVHGQIGINCESPDAPICQVTGTASPVVPAIQSKGFITQSLRDAIRIGLRIKMLCSLIGHWSGLVNRNSTCAARTGRETLAFQSSTHITMIPRLFFERSDVFLRCLNHPVLDIDLVTIVSRECRVKVR